MFSQKTNSNFFTMNYPIRFFCTKNHTFTKRTIPIGKTFFFFFFRKNEGKKNKEKSNENIYA